MIMNQPKESECNTYNNVYRVNFRRGCINTKLASVHAPLAICEVSMTVNTMFFCWL
jgi:hypothetical protein